MKRFLPLTLALAIFLPAFQPASPAATTNEEQQLIAVLQSGSSPTDKDAACARLKRIGTNRSVPALAALLTNEELSHSARYALESMQSSKAGKALLAALGKTTGLTKVGIINSLAFRRETRAVRPLSQLLTDHDDQVASAAATALGYIGGSKALKALQSASANSAAPVHKAIADARLRCAQRLLADGSLSKALAAFQALYDTEKTERIRTAAYRGMILASSKRALPLMTHAILGKDGTIQIAALQLVREVDAPDATKTFAAMLREVEPPVQASLIEGLCQRGDVSAASAISTMLKSPSPQVRLAAINALGILGDDSMVPLLGVAAATSSGKEQEAARLALVDLRRGNPTQTLLRLLPNAKPEVQAEFARALGDRSDKTAVPELVRLARQGSPSASKAALQALAGLVEDSQLGLMVQFVAEAKDDAARAAAADALNSACHQIQVRHGRVNVAPVADALGTGSPATRIALLPVCSGLVDPSICTAFRAAVAARDPAVHAAAVRALCDTLDAELVPDVLKIACEAPEANFRILATRACVRLTTQEETIKLPVEERIAPFKAILAVALSDEQKRLVLSGLAEIPDLEALKLAEPMLNDATVQLEAAKATTKIASALPYAQAEEAKAALTKVVATTTDTEAQKVAKDALKDLEDGADYIIAWEAAGPFMQEGKEYKDLFDIVFPPEKPNARGVKWTTMSLGSDAKRPWIMDLLQTFGGNQRVAYARTWVRSDERRPARLEVGTDDGVKVWLNHQVVHTNNTFRGLQPGSDKINITLDQGWNPLLLKVTQLNAGWAFCVRIRRPDGSHMDGLQFLRDPAQAAHRQRGALTALNRPLC